MAIRFEKLATSPDTPREKLLELIEKGHWYASMVVRNPAVDQDLLRKIFTVIKREYGYSIAAAKLLQSANVDTSLIREFYSECPEINAEEDIDYPEQNCYPVQLAKHPATPADMITKLAESRFYMVREKLAARHDLAEELALQLAKDPSPHVRRILAANVNISTAILEIMANDKDPATLLKVALNPNTSSKAIHALSENPDNTVKLAALTSPSYNS